MLASVALSKINLGFTWDTNHTRLPLKPLINNVSERGFDRVRLEKP